MKAHPQHRPTPPRRVSLPLVLLAIIALVLQPLLSSLHGGTTFAHAHFEGQSPHHAHEQAASPDDHHDAHHDARADVAKSGPRHSGQTDALQSVGVTPNHQHKICCSHSDTPMLVASLSARSGINKSQSVPVPQLATRVPSFRLDVLEGRCTRAGPPPDVPVRSQLRGSSLLGRAPPLSA